MDEGFPSKVKDFLAGTLSREETLALLDQVKKSEECRRILEEQTRLMSAGRRAETPLYRSNSGHDCASFDGSTSSRQQLKNANASDFTNLMPRARKRGLKLLIIVSLLLFALFMTGNWPGAKTKTNPPRLSDVEWETAGALAQGNPIATSPRGVTDSRPMVVSGFLPAGNDEIRLVVTEDGKTVYDQKYDKNSSGAEFEDRDIPGRKGQLKVVDFLLPFPDHKQLVLAAKSRYFYFLELPNGRQSAPLTLDVR